MRQVLLRGGWESGLSWHTWSPGCGVHPLGGVLLRGYIARGVLRGLVWPGAWWRARGGWCEVLVLKTGVESNTGYFVVRCLMFRGQSQVVHHQPAGLVLEHPVHPGDGLKQSMALHGLVHVHGVKAGSVEAGEPHVLDQHDLERVVRVPEPVGQGLPSMPGVIRSMTPGLDVAARLTA